MVLVIFTTVRPVATAEPRGSRDVYLMKASNRLVQDLIYFYFAGQDGVTTMNNIYLHINSILNFFLQGSFGVQ